MRVYIAFPVAPPRLMPELGILDTLRQSSGVDLYRGWRSHFFNQYAYKPWVQDVAVNRQGFTVPDGNIYVTMLSQVRIEGRPEE